MITGKTRRTFIERYSMKFWHLSFHKIVYRYGKKLHLGFFDGLLGAAESPLFAPDVVAPVEFIDLCQFSSKFRSNYVSSNYCSPRRVRAEKFQHKKLSVPWPPDRIVLRLFSLPNVMKYLLCCWGRCTVIQRITYEKLRMLHTVVWHMPWCHRRMTYFHEQERLAIYIKQTLQI